MNIEDIFNNGIVGAGGGGFPANIKLLNKPEFIILNAVECEPLLHKDIEILSKHTDKVLEGLKTIIELTGAEKGIIAIKKKYRDVIELVSGKIDSDIRILAVDDFYPAGDEITLVYLATGRIIQPGKLPADAGCIVHNVETVFNISLNIPVVDKYLTVCGAVKNPGTVKVPVGTSFSDILSEFNIIPDQYAIRSGGLMMGKLEEDQDPVVTKQTGGIIILPADHCCVNTYKKYSGSKNIVRLAKAGCDQCSFCTELCPRYLLGYPVRPETAMRNRIFSGKDSDSIYNGNRFCCECNLCTFYSCPEGLDPKGATVLEKQDAITKDTLWEGLPVKAHPLADYRRVPVKKLMQRLDVLKYDSEAPLSDIKIEPERVRIRLRQHSGNPAKPVVNTGEHVERYDLIGKADGNISANIHASIPGTVIDVNNSDIVIGRI